MQTHVATLFEVTVEHWGCIWRLIMLTQIRRLLGGMVPTPESGRRRAQVVRERSTGAANHLAQLVIGQIDMADIGQPTTWSRAARSKVLGYIAETCNQLTGDPGGRQAAMMFAFASLKVLRNTFIRERIFDEVDGLADREDDAYLCGIEAAAADHQRRAKGLSGISLMVALSAE